jgi:acetyl esterase/lipase
MTTKPHIIVLPGGGYTNHAEHEKQPVVDWLTGLGLDASVFLYPVSTRHPGPLDAVRDEVRRVRATGVERVGLLGFSAGGHAAGLAALDPGDPSAHVDAAILCYPVVSMQLETHAGSREKLIGLDASPALREETSLDRRVSPSAPPFFVWHTFEDAAVPVEHVYLLGRALAANAIPHDLHVFTHGVHGIGLAEGEGAASEWTNLCAKWLSELGWI